MINEILGRERAFRDAELRADTGRLEALLADDFLSIGERGYQLDKGQWIARLRDFRYLSVEITDVDVRCYDRAAILRAIQRSEATWLGEPMNLATRMSQVWVRQPEGWQLAGIQFSSLDAG